MSGLVDRVRGSNRRTAGDSFAYHENGDGMPDGIMLPDGTAYSLDGQPPRAVSKGWGTAAFLYRGRR